jgi:hypothetical protein
MGRPEWHVVFPRNQVKEVLAKFHGGSLIWHLGINKILNKVKTAYCRLLATGQEQHLRVTPAQPGRAPEPWAGACAPVWHQNTIQGGSHRHSRTDMMVLPESCSGWAALRGEQCDRMSKVCKCWKVGAAEISWDAITRQCHVCNSWEIEAL